jgi:hypothetical protein
LQQPAEVFGRLVACGQDVDGAFELHGAEAFQAAGYFDAEVGGLYGELVD